MLIKRFVQQQVKKSLAQKAVDQRRWMKVMMKQERQEKADGDEGVRFSHQHAECVKLGLKQSCVTKKNCVYVV